MGRIRRAETLDTTLADMVSDAFSAITALGEEFREMYDNAPEALQGTDVNQQRDETASAVESLSEPDVDEKLGALPMKWAPWQAARKGRGLSRADKAAEAVARLEAVSELLAEEENNEDAAALASEIDDLRGEIENLEWPGMFG